jgi:undecaprenyl-diphosphatase
LLSRFVESNVIAFDHFLRTWVVGHRVAWLTPLMIGLSAIGRGGMVFLGIGAALALWRRRLLGAFIELALALILASLVADHVVKPAVARDRPFVSDATWKVIGGRPNDASFPSGHAANAFAGAFVLARTVPAAQAIWWGLAAAVAYSRVYLGVHYPLDVIGGALVGLASAAIVLAAARRLRSRFPPYF